MSVAILSAQRSKDPNKQARSLGSAVLAMRLLCSVLSFATCMLKHIHRPACSRWKPNSVGCSLQVGATIVSQDQIILGIGYNGFPRGCKDEELPWAKKSKSGNPMECKYPYVVHAEMNAILNKNTASITGAVSLLVP